MSRPPRGVRATVRWRLTVLYGALFLLAGLVLLAVSYAIVRENIEDELGREREQILADLVAAGAHRDVVGAIADHQLADGRSVSEVMAGSARAVRSEALDELVRAYAIAIPATMLLALLLGWWAAGRALAPVKRLTASAQQISERNLDQRIALEGPDDELKELADTLDALLARLEVAFQSQRRFAADVSHEIRTPLAIVKAEAEVTLGDALSNERERRLARAVLGAADRAEALVASLLALGRSDSTMLARDVVDLAELAGDVVGERIDAADRAGVQLELDLGSAVVVGDRYLLERLVANLVDNGIVHNRPGGGWLRVGIDTTPAGVQLVVANTGPQLAQADVDRITEPFLRLSEDRPGFGLGMAIVRSVVAAHDGTVRLTARPEGGLEVRVDLPAHELPQQTRPQPIDSRV